MTWFQPKPSPVSVKFCTECGVCFKVDPGKPWTTLCQPHREIRKKLDARKRVVEEWARRNWERLEEQAIADTRKAEEVGGHIRQACRDAAQAQNAAMNPYSGAFGGLGAGHP